MHMRGRTGYNYDCLFRTSGGTTSDGPSDTQRSVVFACVIRRVLVMRQPLMRRLVVTATGLGLLFMALVASSVSVGAAPPSIFTNNGCTVGNYACLQAAQPSIFS